MKKEKIVHSENEQLIYYNGRRMKGDKIDMDKYEYGYGKETVISETFDFKGIFVNIMSKGNTSKKVTIIIDKATYIIDTETRELNIVRKYDNISIDDSVVRILENNKIEMILDSNIAKKIYLENIEITDCNGEKLFIYSA